MVFLIRSAYLLLITTLVLANPYIFAQPQNIKFKHYTNKEGLSINTVLCILQDSKGYIWLGTTNGLNKFDGNNFTLYSHVVKETTSISNDIIRDLIQDKDGNIWVATEDGLNKYNLEQDNFESYRSVGGDTTSLSNSLVKEIIETRDGNIWVATYCGTLSLYNKQRNNFTNHRATVVDNKFVNERINCIAEDHERNLWIGTEGGGLFYFNPVTNNIKSYRNIEGDSNSLGHDIVRTILVDSRKNVWIGTSAGLNKFISDKQGFLRYKYDTNQSSSINPGIVDALFEDSRGFLWIGIDGGGLNLMDSTNTFTHYMNNSQDAYSISSNIVRSIYEDKSGNLWVGTFDGGLNLYNKLTAPFRTYFHNDLDANSISNSSVMAFLEDSEGNFWIGTDGGGVNLFDERANKFRSFQHNDNISNSLSSNAVLCLHEDRAGQIWIGTFNGGLNKFNKKTETFLNYTTNYTDNSSLSNPHVWAIYEDTRGNLWIGTMGGGLNLMNRAEGTFKRFVYDETKPGSISSFLVWDIFEDSKGRLWIGTHNGLNLFDYNTQKFTSFQHHDSDSNSLSNNWVLNIFEDKNNGLWIGTSGGGINYFDPEKQTFKAYSIDEGLASNVVSGILEDDHGNLWLSNIGGISKFNPFTKSIQNFDESYGLRSNESNIGASYKSSKGLMLFGSRAGFTVFNPDEVRLNEEMPNVVLTDLYVLNKKVNGNDLNSKLDKHISEAKWIHLNHDDYSFSISYAALNYFANDKYKYAYKLEGFDKLWNEVGKMRTAIYTNIEPGEYIFKVKAANDAGIWNEEGASITIIITPPYWKTWWFKAVLIAVLLSSLYIIYLFKVREIQRHRRVLKKEVDERTSELHESNTQLEEINQEVNQQKEELQTQAEMLAKTNQKLEKSTLELEMHKNNLEELVKIRTSELEKAKEKAEESDQLKTAFLANMSHEIRTPMNAIVGFSNLLNQPDLDDTTRSNYVTQISSNTNSLLTLIDDILDLSMMESNHLSIMNNEFELNLLLDEVFLDVSIQNKKMDLRVTNSIENLNLVVNSDRIRIKQILVNLFNNACKFTENGFVELGCYKKDDVLVLFVKDTGIGISQENLEIIFNRFRKITDDKNKLFRGAGLGLTISKKLAELLEGELIVQSELGVGSTFSLLLPASLIVKSKVSKQNSVQNLFNWENKTILIVEDEGIHYSHLESALRETKVKVVWALNGQMALDLFKAGETFDLVLMDLNLPMLNGYESTSAIKEIKPEQVIVAQTAFANSKDYLELKKIGFDDYLIKPIMYDDLYRVLSRYL